MSLDLFELFFKKKYGVVFLVKNLKKNICVGRSRFRADVFWPTQLRLASHLNGSPAAVCPTSACLPWVLLSRLGTRRLGTQAASIYGRMKRKTHLQWWLLWFRCSADHFAWRLSSHFCDSELRLYLTKWHAMTTPGTFFRGTLFIVKGSGDFRYAKASVFGPSFLLLK